MGSFIKRGLDIVGALLGLLIFLPLLILIAILSRILLGSPVFFRQERPGYKGAPFFLVKFRTMKSGPGSDAERLTRFGRFLRSSSLDELPELWNVLKGEMSLVGPRPLLMQYLGRYSPEQARRHDVKPGMTGWAVVHGRNALSWEEKFKLDVWYVDHWNLWVDFKIVFLTVFAVFRRKGINAAPDVPMPEFMGSSGAAKDRPAI